LKKWSLDFLVLNPILKSFLDNEKFFIFLGFSRPSLYLCSFRKLSRMAFLFVLKTLSSSQSDDLLSFDLAFPSGLYLMKSNYRAGSIFM
jgi:hypothetical protein